MYGAGGGLLWSLPTLTEASITSTESGVLRGSCEGTITAAPISVVKLGLATYDVPFGAVKRNLVVLETGET